ncbi:putative sterigmatocystin biosynthesis protein stcQ [Microdochium trichocladiopsis]|uniref:Sterigmatocystin biosynthesis protein stcQ n=1 Tax=Microdochium trichocladiopsis TaxID=1682393 RepID=A0A9P9BM48_9PEZI|nr:putative sterigmatocystin biosynthesis protein stcQ [Microdochium trichocladiopsis]KAH7025090.1 putative sterigmatocystin biosynthesis protein stcQ [Microdochium trichocladiopsis]
MPRYAILGATGQNGGHVLQTLLDRPDAKIRAFVRSKAKLEKQHPQINRPEIKTRLTMYEGSITDVDVLASCLRGTDAAFLCVAAINSQPGCHIAQDQATNVVAALERIRTSDGKNRRDSGVGGIDGSNTARLPTLIMLSSAATESKLDDVPWVLEKILFAANYHIYIDLIKAEEYLRQRADWVDAVYFKPGGISDDEATGHVLSTEKCQTFVSYWDTAAGMVQIADDGERWHGKSVSVQSKRKARPQYENLPLLFKGLLVYLFPFLYSWLF